MIAYLKKRIAQPSTIVGLMSAAVALAAHGWTVDPQTVSDLLVALGLVHIDESKIG